MKSTATFIVKKYIVELLLASLLLVLWSVFEVSSAVEFDGLIFGAVLVVLLGTLATGYLVFVCAIGAISLLFPYKESLKFIAICSLSFLYVLMYFAYSPKNEVTTPIALGIMTVNIVFSITAFRSKQHT